MSMPVDSYDRLVGLIQDSADQRNGTQQFRGAANIVASCLACLDHQQRGFDVGCESEDVRGGQQRGKVENHDSRLIAGLEFLHQLAHLSRRQHLRGMQLGRAARKHDKASDAGVYQQFFNRHIRHEVVAQARARRQAKIITRARLAQISLDKQGSLVELHRQADCQIDRNQCLTFALIRTGHRQSRPVMLPQGARHLRGENLESLAKAAGVEAADNALFLQSGTGDLNGASLRVDDVVGRVRAANLGYRSWSDAATKTDSTRTPFLSCSFYRFPYALHTILMFASKDSGVTGNITFAATATP